MLSSWHFTDKGIPQGNKDKICVQTAPLTISIICCLLCPSHPPTHPEDRQEADAAQFCAPNSCLPYYNRLCTLRADECILIWRSTTLLTPFQYKRHGCGATCRCVNSSLHSFTCFPGRFSSETTWRRSEITALFVHLRMHAALLIAVQCLLHPAPWFSRHLVSVHLLPAVLQWVSQHCHHGSFDIVITALRAFQKH